MLTKISNFLEDKYIETCINKFDNRTIVKDGKQLVPIKLNFYKYLPCIKLMTIINYHQNVFVLYVFKEYYVLSKFKSNIVINNRQPIHNLKNLEKEMLNLLTTH